METLFKKSPGLTGENVNGASRHTAASSQYLVIRAM